MMKKYFQKPRALLFIEHSAPDLFQQLYTIIQVSFAHSQVYMYIWAAFMIYVYKTSKNFLSAEGNILRSMEVLEHSLLKTTLWLHNSWKTIHKECALTTTMATPTTSSFSTATPSGLYASKVNYTMAGCVLIGMHIFTLTVYVQLKI